MAPQDRRCHRILKPHVIRLPTAKDWGSVEMRFRHIPATGPEGFRMGSLESTAEQPVHRVILTRDYWLGATPVTQAQFACWKPKHRNHFLDRPDHPAENMAWDEAAGFCAWLTERCRRRFPRDFRNGHACLPTEAQWERACRAETNTDYWKGSGTGALDAVGWYGEDFQKGSTHAVRGKGAESANGFGLFDMHGNVDEWCQDAWDSAAYAKRADGVEDPVNEIHEHPEDPLRVFRGGSWLYAAWGCRSAFRNGRHPSDRVRYQGFRVCLVPGPAKSTPP